MALSPIQISQRLISWLKCFQFLHHTCIDPIKDLFAHFGAFHITLTLVGKACTHQLHTGGIPR
ncbi:Uncharacterised protein [Vibrio cholerae]|nr:Uncharacterised protein [Vibrio cholerae]CSI48860.1 Uncharacterised protein [Vibrio cholerae]